MNPTIPAATAPARSGKSTPPGLVLSTAYKADLVLCGASAKVQRS